MEQSLKSQLANIFERKRAVSDVWTNGGAVERYALQQGYKSSNASRRLRELHNEGLLERKIEGKSVWYRWRVQEGETMELFAKQSL